MDSLSRLMGVGGTGWWAMGTQPTAAALTNGNHAATDAITDLGNYAIAGTCRRSNQSTNTVNTVIAIVLKFTQILGKQEIEEFR